MKKFISLILVAAISVTSFGITAFAYTEHVNDGDTPKFSGMTSENVFGSLINWNGIVFGNASNIIDLEGTLAVGGSFDSSRGLSVNNGAYGANPVSTDDVAFLVNGNVNISGYGNVCGQTVVGKADGNTYHLSNVTASETTNGVYTVADASQYFADAKSAANTAKSAIEALPANGECEAANGIYTFVGNSDADTLVYNVDDANFNGYLFDFTISDGQTIIVNLTSSDKIILNNGAVKINGSTDPDVLRGYNRNIVINVINATEIEMTSCELFGILLAPDANLAGNNASVCGTSILNGLTGLNGFELHTGYNNSFVPSVPAITPAETIPEETTPAVDDDPETVNIRIDVPLKMAVAFEDGSVYYGGEMKEVVVGQEYLFQMCSVNWDNGIFDGNENGLRGTVVYRMEVVHRDEFLAIAREAAENPERYTVKGIDVIDNVEKKIIVNCDAADTHLETDVNNFFMAYRFSFEGQNYNKKTGIEKVINTPLESLSVNLPLGSTIACKAYSGDEPVDAADVFVANNSGEGIYDDEYLTSVNDFIWGQAD